MKCGLSFAPGTSRIEASAKETCEFVVASFNTWSGNVGYYVIIQKMTSRWLIQVGQIGYNVHGGPQSETTFLITHFKTPIPIFVIFIAKNK